MNILTLSMVSSAEEYLGDFLGRLTLFRKYVRPEDDVQSIILEGDSYDSTWTMLTQYRQFCNMKWLKLLRQNHGGEVYSSIEHEERFRQLAHLWNTLLREACHVAYEDTDIVIIVEADLQWKPWDMRKLVRYVQQEKNLTIAAPFVQRGFNGTQFWDTWAYRSNGERFSQAYPFHPWWQNDNVTPLDTAGSCLVMPYSVAQVARATEDEELVGFCRDAKEKTKCDIVMPPNIFFVHPQWRER